MLQMFPNVRKAIYVQGLLESKGYEVKCRMLQSFTFFMPFPHLRASTRQRQRGG
jgi:hypothetical protein